MSQEGSQINITYPGNFKSYGLEDFPGGAADKNPPADIGDTGSISGLGRFHLLQGSWACVPQLLKPTRLEPVFCSKRNHHNEKQVSCIEE